MVKESPALQAEGSMTKAQRQETAGRVGSREE